jgi:hypothetical protein
MTAARRVLVMRTVPMPDPAAPVTYCRNCGDPFDMPPADDPTFRRDVPPLAPLPNPSPGRPLVDCGVGGHMYEERVPRCS